MTEPTKNDPDEPAKSFKEVAYGGVVSTIIELIEDIEPEEPAGDSKASIV